MREDLHYHQSILALLESIATLDARVGPVELVACWFDDLYFPGMGRAADYPAETFDRGQREWRECFSSRELQVLAEFHELFSRAVRTLSRDWSNYQSDPGWLNVADAARAALKVVKS